MAPSKRLNEIKTIEPLSEEFQARDSELTADSTVPSLRSKLFQRMLEAQHK